MNCVRCERELKTVRPSGMGPVCERLARLAPDGKPAARFTVRFHSVRDGGQRLYKVYEAKRSVNSVLVWRDGITRARCNCHYGQMMVRCAHLDAVRDFLQESEAQICAGTAAVV